MNRFKEKQLAGSYTNERLMTKMTITTGNRSRAQKTNAKAYYQTKTDNNSLSSVEFQTSTATSPWTDAICSMSLQVSNLPKTVEIIQALQVGTLTKYSNHRSWHT